MYRLDIILIRNASHWNFQQDWQIVKIQITERLATERKTEVIKMHSHGDGKGL
jgi:hypothetical protein